MPNTRFKRTRCARRLTCTLDPGTNYSLFFVPAGAPSTARLRGRFNGSRSRIRTQPRFSAPPRPPYLAAHTRSMRSLHHISHPGTSPTRAIVPVLAHQAVGALRRMRRSGKRLALRKRAAQTLGPCHASVAASQAPHYPVGFCSPSARGPRPFTSHSSISALTAIRQAFASVRILTPAVPRRATTSRGPGV